VEVEPIIFREEGDRVTLEMSRDDYEQLLLILGFQEGSVLRTGDERTFYRWLEFINRLNAGNPRFTPYEIPMEYEGQ